MTRHRNWTVGSGRADIYDSLLKLGNQFRAGGYIILFTYCYSRAAGLIHHSIFQLNFLKQFDLPSIDLINS